MLVDRWPANVNQSLTSSKSAEHKPLVNEGGRQVRHLLQLDALSA
jgi:hypothetical protein